MRNLLTKTLFISLLLPIAALPAVQEKKVKSNPWKEIEKNVAIAIVVAGVLVGMAIGIMVEGTAVNQAIQTKESQKQTWNALQKMDAIKMYYVIDMIEQIV